MRRPDLERLADVVGVRVVDRSFDDMSIASDQASARYPGCGALIGGVNAPGVHAAEDRRFDARAGFLVVDLEDAASDKAQSE